MSENVKNGAQQPTVDVKGDHVEDHSGHPPQSKNSSAHRTTFILLVITVSLFIWYIVSDRLTPYTTAARVKGYVVAVVPEVSGYVVKIPIKKNQLVGPGDPLLQIEKKRYEIEIKRAEAALNRVGQEIEADTAAIATAVAHLAAAEAQLEEALRQGSRTFKLEEKGHVPQVEGDEARKLIKTSRAQVNAAEAELERAKQQRGTNIGENNPRMLAALVALEEAQLNLQRTTIHSIGRGYVGGLKIDEGAYINAGQPAMTFIAVDDIWVEAYMTENQLSKMKNGNKVELAFDAYPGKIFEGKVKSSGVGVSTGKKTDLSDLPIAQKPRGWLRDPQRFPVIIEFTDYEVDVHRTGGLRVNSQVDVLVYTGNYPFWNLLGKVWIRLASIFSYAY